MFIIKTGKYVSLKCLVSKIRCCKKKRNRNVEIYNSVYRPTTRRLPSKYELETLRRSCSHQENDSDELYDDVDYLSDEYYYNE